MKKLRRPSRELRAFNAMKRRCLERGHKDWPRYGGSGVTICPQWIGNFAQFFADMGPAPSERHWLARLDVRGPYAPWNTVWTTQPEQQRRRAFCRRVATREGLMTPAEAERLPSHPSRNTVLRRYSRGFDLAMPGKLYRASTWLTHAGMTLPLPQWAKRASLNPNTLRGRLQRGWTTAQALETPSPLRRCPKVPCASETPRNSEGTP